MKKFSVLLLASCLFFAPVAFMAFDSPGSAPDYTGIGNRLFAHQDKNDTVVSSTVLVSSDLSVPVTANQKVHIRFSLPFTLAGTAPGIKFRVVTPTGGVYYNSVMIMYSDADTVVSVSNILAAADQGFTLATIGNHTATIDFDYVNGSTAGTVVLQFAQNVSDAANTILLRGAYADIIKM